MPSIADALDRIERAFADAPRPPDEELLHADCRDDNDIAALYGIPDWRVVPADIVEREYAALFFLSPAGFRQFLPAYMSWVLRHPKSGAAVVESTLQALTPASGELHAFSLSKFTLLDDAQRIAIRLFLETMSDATRGAAIVGDALAYWRASPGDAPA
ncbi:MAG TPA: DUF6714 family protein [Ktedonobacterales bacterium]|nr:DUF6714 family protein [Ktedonobacterales bacterium]